MDAVMLSKLRFWDWSFFVGASLELWALKFEIHPPPVHCDLKEH